MDYFLNFKNKSYDAQYHESIDPYLSKIIRSNLVTMVVVVPFLPYTHYWQFKMSGGTQFASNIVRTVLMTSVYLFLGIVAIFIHKNRAFLQRHRKAARWVFDILFNMIAGYYAYQFFRFARSGHSAEVQHMYGWWQAFLCVTTFSPISRWYLKLSAYLIVILTIGTGVYLDTNSGQCLIKMFQMAFLEVLLTYFSEKDRRKYFIEKQHLYEETKVYKEIFDMTSDGVIIYGLEEGMLYRNWANEKHRWWNADDSIEQNFEKILLKGYTKVTQLPAVMVKSPFRILI